MTTVTTIGAQAQVAGRATGVPRSHWRSYPSLDLPPVLQAALEAFGELGYHGTSVREVARRAGFTVPAVYYHVRSKQELLVRLLDISMVEFVGRARRAVADAGSDPVRRFTNLVTSVVLGTTHHAALAVLDAELRALEPANRRRYAGRRKQLETLLIGVVQAGVDAGPFRVERVPDTARALLGMWQAIPVWYRTDGPLPPEEIASRYVDIALATVGAAKTKASQHRA